MPVMLNQLGDAIECHITDGDQLQSAHFDIFYSPSVTCGGALTAHSLEHRSLMSILPSHTITICNASGEGRKRNCR